MGIRLPLAAVVAVVALAADSSAKEERGVPVLLFHAVCEDTCQKDDPYGVSRAQLRSLLEGVKKAGFETISPAQYVHGTYKTKKPILVTFDDSRLDSYLNADPVLDALGMRATMYVITQNSVAKSPKFMSWKQIEDADRFGRWDIQLHADAGHVRIPSRPGEELPFYANREWSKHGYESFPTWKRRVEADIRHGNALLASHVPSYQPITFAVPFGDYGQKGSNDPEIEPELRRIFDREFPVWFTQPSRNPPFRMTGPSHEQPRFTVYRDATPDQLLGWLHHEK